MPLIALNKSTGERVDITKCGNPRAQLRADSLVCPVCDSRMIVVAGLIKMAHFRHHDLNECPYTDYGAGESEEHRQAKSWLRDKLQEESGFDVPVHLEYHLPEVGRIADVVQLFPNGWIVVHEIQLAGITVESLTNRTNDYMAAGCDVIWYLGNNADTPANREWTKRFQGFVAHVDLEVEQVEYNRFAATIGQHRGANHGVAVRMR